MSSAPKIVKEQFYEVEVLKQFRVEGVMAINGVVIDGSKTIDANPSTWSVFNANVGNSYLQVKIGADNYAIPLLKL